MRRRLLVALATIGACCLSWLVAPTAVAAPAKASLTRVTKVVAPGDSVTVRANFPTGRVKGRNYGTHPRLRLYRSYRATSGFQPSGDAVKSSKNGVRSFRFRLGTRTVWLKVCNDPKRPNHQRAAVYNNGHTKICTPAVKVVPKSIAAETTPPQSPDPTPSEVLTGFATVALDQPLTTDGDTFTAQFEGDAARSGRTALLQVRRIVTTLTNEVTAPGQWITVASASQSIADGVATATFTVADPLEVAHTYRVVTGSSGEYTSNEVTLGAIAGAKATGLSQLYLNTNEGVSIDSKTRYFETQFSMTASSAYPECTAVSARLSAARGRGNSTWNWPKKPFNLKLDKKADLCGLGKSKKWTLLANYYDRSLLRNSVASYLGQQLDGLAWTPQSRPVDLWLNGKYQGTYLLVERITAELGNRLPYSAADDNRTYATAETAPDTPGFILEWDFRQGGDHNIQTDSGWIAIKDPEDDADLAGQDTGKGITGAQVDYISDYVNDCDQKDFATGGWRDCIDEASAVDYYLAMELLMSIDGNMATSVYMWKPAGGKLRFGPLWDFDIAAGSFSLRTVGGPTGWYLRSAVEGIGGQSAASWFNRLNEDPEFRAAAARRWNQVRDSLSGVDDFLTQESASIAGSAAENFTLWSETEPLWIQVVNGSWPAEVAYLRGWLGSRIEWLTANF